MLEHDAAVWAGAGNRRRRRAGFAPSRSEESRRSGRAGSTCRSPMGPRAPGTRAAHLKRDILQRQHRPAARRAVEVVDALDDDLRAAALGVAALCTLSPLGSFLPGELSRSSCAMHRCAGCLAPDLAGRGDEQLQFALLQVESHAVVAVEGGETALRAKPQAVEIDDAAASSMRRLSASLNAMPCLASPCRSPRSVTRSPPGAGSGSPARRTARQPGRGARRRRGPGSREYGRRRRRGIAR